MGNWRYWAGKFWGSLIAALPITAVIVVFFFAMRFWIPAGTFEAKFVLTDADLFVFLGSSAAIILGMTFFNVGTESSMTEVGQLIGGSLLKKKNLFFVIAMTFILGVLVTIAEPDLSVLSGQIGINSWVIILTIGLGVGVFLVIGVIRVFFKKNLKIFFLTFYALAFALIYIINPRFLPSCFDSGVVTTGPVTVPFLLGFGLGLSATRGSNNADSDASFGLTALSSIGPILAVIIISIIMKAMGQELPSMAEYVDPLSSLGGDIGETIAEKLVDTLGKVALSVGPILGFFLIYNALFLHLPLLGLFRIILGMVVTYIGLVLFLSAVEIGFMPVASKLGQALGSVKSLLWLALILGGAFGVFGVLAEPAVHILVQQIEDVSGGSISRVKVLIAMAVSIGLAVVLQIIRSYFEFSIIYYLLPGYIIVFALSFLVPNLHRDGLRLRRRRFGPDDLDLCFAFLHRFCLCDGRRRLSLWLRPRLDGRDDAAHRFAGHRLGEHDPPQLRAMEGAPSLG